VKFVVVNANQPERLLWKARSSMRVAGVQNLENQFIAVKSQEANPHLHVEASLLHHLVLLHQLAPPVLSLDLNAVN
jgi:hypothetical protein